MIYHIKDSAFYKGLEFFTREYCINDRLRTIYYLNSDGKWAPTTKIESWCDRSYTIIAQYNSLEQFLAAHFEDFL